MPGQAIKKLNTPIGLVMVEISTESYVYREVDRLHSQINHIVYPFIWIRHNRDKIVQRAIKIIPIVKLAINDHNDCCIVKFDSPTYGHITIDISNEFRCTDETNKPVANMHAVLSDAFMELNHSLIDAIAHAAAVSVVKKGLV